MGASKENHLYTVDEYLEFERSADERHIYVDGRIFALSEGFPALFTDSIARGFISTNLIGLLWIQSKETDCTVFGKDVKVGSASRSPNHQDCGLFFYPDVFVLSDHPDFHDKHEDVIINPTAIFEVLTPATEAFRRGSEFIQLQTGCPTLTEYILVSQNQPQIEHFSRRDNGIWSYQRYASLDASLTIESIHCTLKLADVYDRVSFEDDENEGE